MTITTHPSPATCRTGSFTQRWDCGWHQDPAAAYHVGYIISPFLFIALTGLLVAAAVIKTRQRSSQVKPRPRTIR